MTPLRRFSIAPFIAFLIALAFAVPASAEPQDIQDGAKTGQVLRYRGVHFGKHPVTTYEMVTTTRAGREADQYVLTIDTVRKHDGDTPNPLIWQITDTRSMNDGEPSYERMALPLLGVGHEFRIRNASLSGFVLDQGRRVDLPEFKIHPGDHILGGVYSLNSAFRALSLVRGQTTNVRIVDFKDDNSAFVLRPFAVRVLGTQSYQLGGKSVSALRIRVDPLDGNPVDGGTLLVSEASPHVVFRSELVAAFDAQKKELLSTGTEALVEMTKL